MTGYLGSFQLMEVDVFENYECEGQINLEDYTKNSRQLTHLSLFSGIGGLDLAAEWAGIETVGQCEWADYPTKVLEKHWPDIPRWKDIRTLTGGSFYERTGRRTVDIISGGFPCQPFSVAGKQRGKEDDRFLWPEMVRVIAELRPTWVIGENVAGIINLALDDILFDLESQGYETRTFLLPAHAVGAPHRRYRTAIVGYSKSKYKGGLPGREEKEITGSCINGENVSDTNSARRKKQHTSGFSNGSGFSGGNGVEGTVCDTSSQGLQERSGEPLEGQETPKQKSERSNSNVSDTNNWRRTVQWDREWWATEPDVGRVANGVPHRVDRLKCLGNAVVPQQFYPIFKAIADIELLR